MPAPAPKGPPQSSGGFKFPDELTTAIKYSLTIGSAVVIGVGAFGFWSARQRAAVISTPVVPVSAPQPNIESIPTATPVVYVSVPTQNGEQVFAVPVTQPTNPQGGENIVSVAQDLGPQLLADLMGPAPTPRAGVDATKPGGVAEGYSSQPVVNTNQGGQLLRNCVPTLFGGVKCDGSSTEQVINARPVVAQPVAQGNGGMSPYEASVSAAQNQQSGQVYAAPVQGYAEQVQILNPNRCLAQIAGQTACIEFLGNNGNSVSLRVYDMAGGVHECPNVDINYYNSLPKYALADGDIGYTGQYLPQGCQ